MRTAKGLTPSAKSRRSGRASGPTRSRQARLAAGQVQLVVWLDPEDAAALERLEAAEQGEGARSRVVRMAIREAAGRRT